MYAIKFNYNLLPSKLFKEDIINNSLENYYFFFVNDTALIK